MVLMGTVVVVVLTATAVVVSIIGIGHMCMLVFLITRKHLGDKGTWP